MKSMKKNNISRNVKSVVSIILSMALAVSGAVMSPDRVEAQNSEISNPRISKDGKVTWDLLEFGTYPQKVTGFKTEPIKWRILSVSADGTDALVLADKGLDGVPYLDRYLNGEMINEEFVQENITWGESTLRKWLNEDFYNKAFTQGEKNAINVTDVTYQVDFTNIDDYDSSGSGNTKTGSTEVKMETTKDNVYVLSVEEVTNSKYGFGEKVSSYDDTRVARITDYAKYNGAQSSIASGVGNMNSEWWVRSPRFDYPMAPCVCGNGLILKSSPLQNKNCVRPAMHINLKSSYVRDAGEIDSQGNIYNKNNGYSNPKSENGNTIWDCVYFGSYEQSAIFEEQPIVWRVLSVNEDGTDAFLLSDSAIDCKPYHSIFDDEVVTWEKCTLRKWLNGEFYNTAFSAEERSVINKYKVINEPSPVFGTDSGNDTTDYVYLMSISEAVNYKYGFNEEYDETDTRVAYATDYAWMQGAGVRKDAKDCHWDLRTAGLYSNYNACIHPDGDVLYGGGGGGGVTYISLRPVLHINLKASNAKYSGTTSAAGGTYEPKKTNNVSKEENDQNNQNNQNNQTTTEKNKTNSDSSNQKTTSSATKQTVTKNNENAKNQEDKSSEKSAKKKVTKVKAPAKPVLKSVKNKKTRKLVAKWKKVKGAKGYQIQYALNKKFTKTKKAKFTRKTSITLKKLKKKKTYYVRVRAFKLNAKGKKVYSKWSKIKKLKIKR